MSRRGIVCQVDCGLVPAFVVRNGQPHRVHRHQHSPMHVRIQVQVGFAGSVDGKGVRRDPPLQQGSVIPFPKVDKPNLDIIFLAGKAVVLSKLFPPSRTKTALHFAVSVSGASLH